jgi:hypothetical protein
MFSGVFRAFLMCVLFFSFSTEPLFGPFCVLDHFVNGYRNFEVIGICWSAFQIAVASLYVWLIIIPRKKENQMCLHNLFFFWNSATLESYSHKNSKPIRIFTELG